MVSLKHDWINVLLHRRCWNDQHSWPYLPGVSKNERFGSSHGFDHVPLERSSTTKLMFFLKHWQWSDPPKSSAAAVYCLARHFRCKKSEGLLLQGDFSHFEADFVECLEMLSTLNLFNWKLIETIVGKDVFQIVLLNRFPVYIFCSRERGRNEIRCCGCAYLFAFTGHLIHGVLVRNTLQQSPQHLNVRKLWYFA